MIKPKKGQWLFTCSMQPLQFSHFTPRDPKAYNQAYIESLSVEELDKFINDGFVTIEGSHHSISNCSMRLISESYAKWFIENEIWKRYDKFSNLENGWELYHDEIKSFCESQGIVFEGF